MCILELQELRHGELKLVVQVPQLGTWHMAHGFEFNTGSVPSPKS